MPDLTTSADIDAFLAAANDAAARTELGLGALATVTPGTGVAAALALNVGSAGAPVLFNGAAGTPSSLTGTNITGTAAGLTAGTASAVAVGGITGLGTGVGTFLATPSSANLLTAITDETGSGALVFGTSPTFTTSIVAGGTTIALFNTVATTVNAFGVATTLNIGAGAATVLNFGGFTSAAELRFLEPSGSGTNYSGFKQAALAASITYTLPTDAPANGDVLTSQSNGTLSWETPSGAANAVTAASTAASAGLLWISAGADRSAEATDTVDDLNTTNLTSSNLTLGGTLVTATGAELNFVDGVTSAIQTQIDGKQPLDSDLTSWAGVTRASGFDTFAATPSGENLGSLLTSALTVAKGGTGLTAGTSGGILGYTATGTLASSAALAANAIVIGGGAGATPTTTTTGTGVLTLLGVAANGSASDGPGYRGVPQNSQSAAYTTVMADNGKHILHPTADNNARTFTIDSNANVAYPIGASITFINQINTVTIAITSDTLVLAGAGTTGSRTLAANGIATAVKIASTTWMINGTGLT